MKLCSESITDAYIEFGEGISQEVAFQLLADIMFLEMALPKTAFSFVKDKFSRMVQAILRVI
jgi:hypothetical protein